MLVKLLKHEFKATSRFFLITYIFTLAVALIIKLVYTINNSLVTINESSFSVDMNNSSGLDFVLKLMITLTMFLFVICIVCCLSLAFFVMIGRFYTNLFGSQGYLMNTIPVTPKHHIFTKLICSFAWTLVGIIVSGLALGIIFGDALLDFIDTLQAALVMEDVTFNEVVTFYSFIGVFSYISSNLMIYCSIALGQTQNKHKVLFSVIFYLVIYFIMQIISLAGLFGGFMIFEGNIDEFVGFSSLAPLYIFSGLSSVIYSVIFFIITNNIMKKKLNLE